MKEPDVSSWSREELEQAYKQMAKNCAARGQSLAYAKKRTEELEKQLAGMQPDGTEQLLDEQKAKIETLGIALDDERESREKAVAYAEELEKTIADMRAAKVKEVRAAEAEAYEVSVQEEEQTMIIVRGTRPNMMTVYFLEADE